MLANLLFLFYMLIIAHKMIFVRTGFDPDKVIYQSSRNCEGTEQLQFMPRLS